ncbi:MAG: XylR family transcriptional regulator [Kiritimatiellae bacterium]|nr:XylR family transcriptional regulator [Kiritimatiellia bacterium]
MNPVRTRLPQVALLLPTSIKTCRELLRGILQFVHLHGPWGVHIIEGREGEQKLFRPAEWGCTGIIVDLSDRHYASRLLTANVPTIITNPSDEALDPVNPLSRFSRVVCDNRPIGKCAAEYFLERKFLNFAFVGQVNDASWSEERRTTFCERLAQDRFSCIAYPKLSLSARKDFCREQNALCNWLRVLPKPVAILVANDVRARQVLDSCIKAGLAVPQEIAVLGVDNDEMLCETTTPQMSSIQLNTEQAGFEAARVLDGMMHNIRRGAVRQTVIKYGFSYLVTRRSTETVQIADVLVARSLDFIRINAGSNITVDDIIKNLHVSRRSLETRFKTVMGRTVYAEIMRVRLERVKTMLREKAMTIEAIADACCFASASHLGTVFRQHSGVTPSAFRRQVHGRGK